MKAAVWRLSAACLCLGVMSSAGVGQAQDIGEAIAEAAGIPNIPAFLPDRYSVGKTDPMPIDGVWMISTLRKKIRIEAGRAYAMDPWLHMFVLKVMPDMVVMQNFRRTGPGVYGADDLPLLGPATLRLQGDGNLDVTVQGKLGPVRYGLVKLEASYPDRLQDELYAMSGRAPQGGANDYDRDYPPRDRERYRDDRDEGYDTRPYPADDNPRDYRPEPDRYREPERQQQPDGEVPEDCVPVNVDPNTGEMICA